MESIFVIIVGIVVLAMSLVALLIWGDSIDSPSIANDIYNVILVLFTSLPIIFTSYEFAYSIKLDYHNRKIQLERGQEISISYATKDV